MTSLPEILQPFAARLEATRKPIIGALFTDERRMSQLGGRPWWPKSLAYPQNAEDKPLFLLIQIDFSEAPPLDPFPRAGLLQIFIDGYGDIYGCDLNDPFSTRGVAYRFHKDISQETIADFGFLEAFEEPTLPLEMPLEPRYLAWFDGSMLIESTDYRFDKLFPEIAGDDDLGEAYWGDMSECPAIRLGGYPTFTQEDPRGYQTRHALSDFTLLTIDTTDGIMWGDCGVAQFFIDEAALARRDFSKVGYNWDCC